MIKDIQFPIHCANGSFCYALIEFEGKLWCTLSIYSETQRELLAIGFCAKFNDKPLLDKYHTKNLNLRRYVDFRWLKSVKVITNPLKGYVTIHIETDGTDQILNFKVDKTGIKTEAEFSEMVNKATMMKIFDEEEPQVKRYLSHVKK